MVDIIITTYNRKSLLEQALAGVLATKEPGFRLWIHDDASTDGTQDYLCRLEDPRLAYVVLSKQRRGVVPAFNMLWNMVDYFDLFWEERPYLCYLQDDIVPQDPGWLLTCIEAFEDLGKRYNIGFFTGYHANEHPVRESFEWHGRTVMIKDSTTASNMIATKSFWRSVGWVPRLNPDGSVRGFPNKNRGSHIDLYLMGCMSGSKFVARAAANNCSYLQGRKVLVVPKLLEHIGQNPAKSTWRRAI